MKLIMGRLDQGYHNMVDIDWTPYELWMKIKDRFLGDHQTNISLLSDKLEKIRGKDMVDYANKFESCFLAYRDGGGTLPEEELIAKFYRNMPSTREAMGVQQQLEWEESRRLA